MHRKTKEKEQAIQLRLEGMSYPQIAKKVKVANSSLSRWLRDIPYRNKQFGIMKTSDAFKNRGHILHLDRLLRTESIKSIAAKEVGDITKRDLFISGIMLYWAEGTKVGEEVCVSNSNPEIIKFAMKWFREICEVPKDKFRLQMHLHTDLDHDQCLKRWMNITGLPKEQFHKTYIKKSSLGHRKKSLYSGTIKVRVNDRNLHRKIMGWIQALALC